MASRPTPPSSPAARTADSRTFFGIVLVLLLSGAAVLWLVIRRSQAAAPNVSTTVVADAANTSPVTLDYVMGSDSAKVEIVMFGDFQCPGCGAFATQTEPQVRKELVEPGHVRLRFRDFPLYEIHQNALPAHNAAACAYTQGKFWEMHDKLYHGQSDWALRSNPNPVFVAYARALALDDADFSSCLESRRLERQIIANRRAGDALGVNSTPTFQIGRRLIGRVLSFADVKAYVDSARADAAKAQQE
jgi:protein-disulfide isomerase